MSKKEFQNWVIIDYENKSIKLTKPIAYKTLEDICKKVGALDWKINWHTISDTDIKILRNWAITSENSKWYDKRLEAIEKKSIY